MKKIFLLLLSPLFLGLYGLTWDQGYHLHPDERMLIMVADKISFFNNLNPDFFNYGSLPIYLLKGTAQVIDGVFFTHFANYAYMLYIGRILSIIAFVLTVFFVYKISLLLFKKERIALLSSFFYTISPFTIQNSHFFVVDVFLTLFTTLLIYFLLQFISLRSHHDRDKVARLKYIVIIGMIFAAMMSSKFTAIIFLPIIFVVIFLKTMKPRQTWLKQLKNLAISLLFFIFSFLFFHFLFMPYAFLNFSKYFTDIMAQVRMNSNPYVFPYTLQYVFTTPYIYYLKNIFLWGTGPITSILSFVGIIICFLSFRTKCNEVRNPVKRKDARNDEIQMYILFFIFYFSYFLIIGHSSVKFMRYMLPIYPFLAITAGYGFTKIYSVFSHTITDVSENGKQIVRGQNSEHRNIRISDFRLLNSVFCFLKYLVIILAILWSLMFINIYSQPHTRITASEWILKNIPKGSTIALEHWDDALPLTGQEYYNFLQMTLYDQPDNNIKWVTLNNKLKQSDYLVLASNRLYIPLQKLADCSKYTVCYPKTAEYYKRLFNGDNLISNDVANFINGIASRPMADRNDIKEIVQFKKVAEFAVYPYLKLGNRKLELKDDSADESFTVYDHPKIMIFKKV